MQQDYIHDEKTIINILLDKDTLGEVQLEKLFSHLPDIMFLSKDCKTVYNIIKKVFNSEDRELIGTNHFNHKVQQIAFMELDDSDYFFKDLDDYWTPKSTVWSWVKKIQKRYFDNRFKEACSEQEFEDIIKEKQRYALEDRMAQISEDASKAIEIYEQKKNSSIKTTYPSIDEQIGSLQGGDMIVLAASTGCGKTAFMLNIAKAIAKEGKKVDIFSLEMPRWQLQQRIICSEACVEVAKFRDFTLSEEDKNSYFSYANNQFKKMPINIFTKQTVSIDEIKAIEMKSDSEIVFIDYLGLIDSYGNKSSYEKYSEISRQIKLIAMQTNKPIVALHQLNRNFQEREDKKPKISDLRDSGKIEQDADMIWLLYRPWLFEPTKNSKEDIRFILAKNRHGNNNKEISLILHPKYQQILEPIRDRGGK